MNLMQVLVICSSLLLSTISLAEISLVPSKTPFEDYIKRGFAHCKIEKENLFLNKKQLNKSKELSKITGQSALGLRFRVNCPKKETIYAYVDSHIVRTLNETLVTYIQGRKIVETEILHFLEPQEYKPPKIWLNQFQGKKLTDELKVYGEIDGLSGATLSVRAVTYSARRVLALHETLEEKKMEKSNKKVLEKPEPGS